MYTMYIIHCVYTHIVPRCRMHTTHAAPEITSRQKCLTTMYMCTHIASRWRICVCTKEYGSEHWSTLHSWIYLSLLPEISGTLLWVGMCWPLVLHSYSWRCIYVFTALLTKWSVPPVTCNLPEAAVAKNNLLVYALQWHLSFTRIGITFGDFVSVFVFVCVCVKKETPLFNTKSDNKEQRFETIGQSKSLHGKPFPTASQFQDQSRFEERWWHPLLGLICVKDGKCW